MEITNTTLGVSFSVIAAPTVRQQLRYWSNVAFTDRGDLYEKYWNAAHVMIIADSWKCEGLALDANLETLTDHKAVDIIQYVGLAVFAHVKALESVSPN